MDQPDHVSQKVHKPCQKKKKKKDTQLNGWDPVFPNFTTGDSHGSQSV